MCLAWGAGGGQSLVYESVGALTAGLRVMLGDGDVAVERIKNRLDPAYDSLQSCGYRWVGVGGLGRGSGAQGGGRGPCSNGTMRADSDFWRNRRPCAAACRRRRGRVLYLVPPPPRLSAASRTAPPVASLRLVPRRAAAAVAAALREGAAQS